MVIANTAAVVVHPAAPIPGRALCAALAAYGPALAASIATPGLVTLAMERVLWEVLRDAILDEQDGIA